MSNDSGQKAAQPVAGRSLTRREWVQRMLAGAGAGLTVPPLGVAHSVHVPLASLTAPSAAPAVASGGEWSSAFFDDHQNKTLVALAERIVPGSTEVQVNRFLDTALGAETQEVQQKFVASLNALEGEALRQFTQSFKDLPAPKQDEVLTVASTTAPSNAGFADGTPVETLHGEPNPAPNLRDYFDFLKGWISTGYYSSETGMKELGWRGENFFATFPSCEHPGGHS